MKTRVVACLILLMQSFLLVQGQGTIAASAICPKISLSQLPCTTPHPSLPGVWYCAEGKEYKASVFRASWKAGKLFLFASKPLGFESVFPVVHLFVVTTGNAGFFESSADSEGTSGTYNNGASDFYTTTAAHGSCQVEIAKIDSIQVIGSFAMTGYDAHGASAKVISGRFWIPFKKE